MYLQYITNSKRNTSSALYLIVTVAPFAQELIDYAFHESCLATRIIEAIETRKRKETKAEGPKISSYLVDGSRLAIRLARIRYVTSAYTMNKIATGARASPFDHRESLSLEHEWVLVEVCHVLNVVLPPKDLCLCLAESSSSSSFSVLFHATCTHLLSYCVLEVLPSPLVRQPCLHLLPYI